VIDDLLYAMVGIEGKYVRVRRGRFKDGNTFSFYMDPSMDANTCKKCLCSDGI
jgi:hypothetical protein